MSRVTRLEEEVRQLSEPELAQFREWYLDFDEGCWDRQIEADAKNGRLDDMAAEAAAEYKKGGSREL
ncbi:MAG: hypothetical protein GVY32_06595 [Gammaproteobacteria bacterium]|jgi:hypothetical protein|nr:hypothetical protein [Gammaproteobacteria bacterium]NBD95387.1 hypothetical protein [Gammaproteobacteria bacterium]